MGNDGFRVAARTLRQLGAELITSDDIALNELIKNAFDARSKQVVVKVFFPFALSEDKLLEKCQLKKNQDATLSSVLTDFVNPSVSKTQFELIQKRAEELEPKPRANSVAALYKEFCLN